MSEEIIINQKFKDLIQPLTPDELEKLQLSLDAYGCRDAILVWRKKNIILDGHNRYEWCQKKKIPFDVKYVTCTNDKTAEKFIIRNQLARRNLSPDVVSMLNGKLYNNRKKETPNPEGANQHKEVKGNSCPQQTTAENIAKETGVSPRTVKNNAKYASAVEKLGVEKEVINGTWKKSRKQTIEEAEKLKPTKIKRKQQPKKSDGENVATQFGKLSWEEMKISAALIDEIYLEKKNEIAN